MKPEASGSSLNVLPREVDRWDEPPRWEWGKKVG